MKTDPTTIVLSLSGKTATTFVRDLTRDLDGATLLKLIDFISHTGLTPATARAVIKGFLHLNTDIGADVTFPPAD